MYFRFALVTLITWCSTLFLNAAKAQVLSALITVYCKDASLSQVFESCEEIQILEKVGNRVRAYSKPKRSVLTLKPETVFVARPFLQSEKIRVGESVTVVSSRVWNSSHEGFLGTCTVGRILNEGSKDELVVVNCGRYRNEKISKSAIYRLRPYSFDDQRDDEILRSHSKK